MGLLSSIASRFAKPAAAPRASAFSGFGGFTATGWRFMEAVDQDGTVPLINGTPRDFDKDVPLYDRNVLVQASRRLYANCGIVKAADDKATYAVGNGWDPLFLGKDKDWGRQASDWLKQKYFPISDVRGGIYDFKTNLHLDSVNIDVSGDFGILSVRAPSGWPMTQRVPSHRIDSCGASEGKPLETGKYQGLIIRQGVIYNAFGRAVGYRIRTDDEAGYQDVSARDFFFCMDPAWYDQGRGVPAYAHAIKDLLSLKSAHGFEAMAMNILSAIGLIEENETGGPDPTEMFRNEAINSGNTTGPAPAKQDLPFVKTMFGGLVRFFRSQTGSKLSTLQHSRPGPNWESFWNRIVKMACAGTGWPYELLWNLSSLGGAALRSALGRANRAVQDRQNLLRPAAKWEVQRAIAAAIELGELPFSPDWWRWDFVMPPALTVDAGRDAQQDREDYKLKITTLEDILAPEGKTVEQHYETLADEYLLLQEVAERRGVPPDALGQAPKPTVITETLKD